MKSNRLLPYLILVFGCLLILPGTAFGQKDSVRRDTIKEEYNKESDFYLKRREKYDYLTRAKVEELSMFKISVSYFNLYLQEAYAGPSIGYEKKLSPDFSLFGDVGAAFPVGLIKGDFIIGNASIAGRYYYNMREKIWEGKSANNLSGNYFSLQLSNYFYFYDNKISTDIPLIEGLYGIQRRLGRLCFFDLNAGFVFEVGQSYVMGPGFVLSGKFGFGL